MERLFRSERGGGLAEADLLKLLDHLDSCPACQADYDARTYEERRQYGDPHIFLRAVHVASVP